MRNPPSQDPVRWRSGGADTHAIESRAGVLADAAAEVPSLTPQALSRIRSAVLARRSDDRSGALRRLPLAAQLALGLGVVLLCATTAGGATLLWRKYVSGPRHAAPPAADATPAAPTRLSHAASPRSSSPATAPETPAPAPEAASAGIESPRPAAAPAPVSVPRAPPSSMPRAASQPRALVPESPAATGALSPPAFEPSPTSPPERPAAPARLTEAALVADALAQLRQRSDPRAALATLDRHAREFPHGVLGSEAARTRIEATLQLRDLKAALALLDARSAPAEALGADLLLTRAELRAANGRFREALADFTRVFDGEAGLLPAGGDERALYGRAVCRARLGQDDRARVDLLAYQRRFPDGRFATEVRRLLAEPSPPAP